MKALENRPSFRAGRRSEADVRVKQAANNPDHKSVTLVVDYTGANDVVTVDLDREGAGHLGDALQAAAAIAPTADD